VLIKRVGKRMMAWLLTLSGLLTFWLIFTIQQTNVIMGYWFGVIAIAFYFFAYLFWMNRKGAR
jgi:hypothetical protein